MFYKAAVTTGFSIFFLFGITFNLFAPIGADTQGPFTASASCTSDDSYKRANASINGAYRGCSGYWDVTAEVGSDRDEDCGSFDRYISKSASAREHLSTSSSEAKANMSGTDRRGTYYHAKASDSDS